MDVAVGQEVLTLVSHGAGVDNVASSPDGRYLFTESEGGTARVWDILPEGSRQLLTLVGHRDMVFRIAYSPDGTHLAVSDEDGSIYVLPIEDLTTLA